jgi:tetratricopeptide (TPR) repeat protein
MINRRPALLVLIILFSGMSSVCLATAGDLMSQALKSKAAGKLTQAASQLEQAVAVARHDMQKHLALFILADCQVDLKQYTKAVKTLKELYDTVSDPEEKAEALFRLIQVESRRGRKSSAGSYYNDLKKKFRSSAYYELATSFIKAEGLAGAVAQAARHTPQPEAKIKKQPEKQAKPKLETRAKAPAKAPGKKTTASITRPAPKTAAISQAKATGRQSGKQHKTLPAHTALLIKEALTIESTDAKDKLIPQVLKLQDDYKKVKGRPGADRVLFELAHKTADFGEMLEACKLYDQLLKEFPSSAFVEQAYYEAIRLRAALGVHEAVVSWSKAFLAAFPSSEKVASVKALLAYSEKNGQVDLSNAAASKKAIGQVGHAKKDQSHLLNSDSNYAQASRKIKEGKYNLALVDLNALSKKYPAASKLWWDMALVYVQFEDFPAAEIAVKKMLLINPESEEGNSLLGYIQYRLEDYQGAASSYERAGESEGRGVNFFNGKRAAERMQKSAGSQ